MGKTGFLLYNDQRQLFAALEPPCCKALMLAIFDYEATGAEPTALSPVAFMAFLAIRAGLDRNTTKHAEVCAKRKAAAALGGAAKAAKWHQMLPNGSNCSQELPHVPDNERESDRERESDSETLNVSRKDEAQTPAPPCPAVNGTAEPELELGQPPPQPQPPGKKRRKPQTETTEEWVAAMREAYKPLGVDVDREMVKCAAWLRTNGNGRTMTRKTLLNWLNKADKGVHAPSGPIFPPKDPRTVPTECYDPTKW